MQLKVLNEIQEMGREQKTLIGMNYYTIPTNMILILNKTYSIKKRKEEIQTCHFCQFNPEEERTCKKKIYYLKWDEEKIKCLCDLLEYFALEEILLTKEEQMNLIKEKKLTVCQVIYKEHR